MRLLLRILLGTIVIAPLALVAALYLAFDSAPAIQRAAEISPANIERARRILEQNDPRRLRPGARRTIRVGETDLDLAANYLARQYADGAARLKLKPKGAVLSASLRVPVLSYPAYLNMRAEIAEGAALPRIESLVVGRLPIPGSVAQWWMPRLLHIALPEADLRAFAGVVQKISLHEDRALLTYTWQSDLPGKMRAVLVPPDDRERLRAYHERLTAVSRSVPPRHPSLVEFLAPLFTLAAERSASGDAVAENRAVLLLLALYVNGRELGKILPDARAWSQPRSHAIRLNGRADLAKHFIVSAALAAKAGGPLADAVGLYKELADAREGSGFSFNDLAADRAGSRFGEAAANPDTARDLQQRLGPRAVERDLVPITADLPEFMPEHEFVRRFGGVDAPAYKEMTAEIERRIAALPLYR